MVAGLPEHKIRVISPDIGGGFGNKVPIYPGYLCAIVGSIAHRQAGQVDRGPLGEPHQHRVRPRLPHARRDRGHARTARSSPSGSTCSPTTAPSTASPQPSQYPAGFFGVFTGCYDIEAAHCHDDRRLHQQGAGRRRLLLLVPDHRGRVPGRAAGRLPRRTSWAWTRPSCGWRNLLRPEQFPYTTPTGWDYDSGDYQRTLAAGAGHRRLRRAARASRQRRRARSRAAS